jgi:hypothetical protein
MSRIKLDYYGFEGAGRTVKEAKADAGAKIRAALSGDFSPWSALTHDGQWGVIVWREPANGWAHRLITPGGHGDRGGSYGRPDRTREEAIRDAVKHLASCAGLSAVEALVGQTGPLPISYMTLSDLDDARRMEAWQERYKTGRATHGMDDTQAREFAGSL